MIIEQDEIPIEFHQDGSITVTLLAPGEISGMAIMPGIVDFKPILKNPSINVGKDGPRAASVCQISITGEGNMTAKVRFDDTEIGRKSARLYGSGLLWSIQSLVNIKEYVITTQQSRMSSGLPDECERVATEASIESIFIDPYAPY